MLQFQPHGFTMNCSYIFKKDVYACVCVGYSITWSDLCFAGFLLGERACTRFVWTETQHRD